MRTFINLIYLINFVDLFRIEFPSKMRSVYRFGIHFLIVLLGNHKV